MKSLKERATEVAKGDNRNPNQEMEENYEDIIGQLKLQVQAQRLLILSLEDDLGAIAQENEWFQSEIMELKNQIAELESLIYSNRYL